MARYDLNNYYSTEEVSIYFSAVNLIFLIVFIFGLLVGSILVIQFTESYFMSVLLIVMALVILKDNYSFLKDFNQVQLKFTAKGLNYKGDFENWDSIENERIEKRRNRKLTYSFLVYYVKEKDKVVRIPLENLSVEVNDVMKLVSFFRKKQVQTN